MSTVSKCRIARSLYLANPSMPWKGNQYALNVWVLKKMRKTKTWKLCKWNGWFLPLPSMMPSPCLPQTLQHWNKKSPLFTSYACFAQSIILYEHSLKIYFVCCVILVIVFCILNLQPKLSLYFYLSVEKQSVFLY